MGLDMYLERMPRYKGVTPNIVRVVEEYLDYQNKIKDPNSEAKNYTFKEWCGYDEVDIPPQDYIDFYSQFYEKKYSSWDTEKKYGWDRIMEQVGYWRKANHIHNWFVENVQNGIDDCQYHSEVTEVVLKRLLNTCVNVLESCRLVEGKINDGYEYQNGERIPIIVDGKYVENTSVAEELLPTTSGFFFGGTGYDEWYVKDIENTIEIIREVLDTTNFETSMVYYVSSW